MTKVEIIVAQRVIGEHDQELPYLRRHHIRRNATHYIQQLK